MISREPCAVERHYITTPYGANSIFGKEPNGVIFPNRNTYELSTSGYQGELDWLVVISRNNFNIPNFSDGVLREQGIYTEGEDSVMLKAPTREPSLMIGIKGFGNRLGFMTAREYFAGIFSWDLATSVVPENPSAIPDPSQLPEPWTYSWVRQDGEIRHLDFAIGWLNSDSDQFEQETNSLVTTLVLSCDKPWFYSDEEVYEFETVTDGRNIFPNKIFYDGTARGVFRLEFGFPNLQSGSLDWIDFIDDGLQKRTRRLQAMTGSWPVTTSADRAWVMDTGRQVLTRNDKNMATDFDAEVSFDWASFQFVPYRFYNFGIKTSPEMTVRGRLIYSRRFAGI